MRPPLQRPTTYDIEQEQQRHDDAIHWFGEMCAFLLWWNAQDFDAGLVQRCSACYTSYGDIAEAYGQAAQTKCPSCFGTTYEGGLRAIYYRPALWQSSDTDEGVTKRGFIDSTSGTIQIVSNLPVRKGDTVVRADGSRWDIGNPEAQEITTGFGSQRNINERQMRTGARVNLEDPDSHVYLPFVDLDSLNLQGWVGYVPHSPHGSDQAGPDPVLQPGPGSVTAAALNVQRGREFSVLLRFYQDTARTITLDVSAKTYVSQFRVGPSALSTVLNTLSVDMTNAAAGEVRVWLSDSLTDDIIPDFVYWDVYSVEGAENVSIMLPRRLAVI